MSVKDEVIKIVAAVCETEVEKITEQSSVGDFPGWDSMGHLSILQQVEETLNVNFEPEEMMELEDVADIVKAVEAKL